MKITRFISVFLTLCFASAGHAQGSFPQITADNLNGTSFSFPAQLPADPTIVFIAYKQRQQDDINAWVAQMGLQESGGRAWIEMPVVGQGAALMRSFIDNGMRSGIQSPAIRDKTFTIYSSRRQFNRALGISSNNQIYVALVGQDGTVFARVSGEVTAAKISELLSAYP